MGLFILFFFAITEIALAALTLIKWPAKADFRRNRLLATAAEFLLLALIMVLPTTYLKWRFAVAVGLAGIRLGIACIRFFGGKTQGNVKKAARIVCCVLVLVLTAMSLLPSFLFANYNGRFTAVLFSGEETVISRKYVPELKKALKGEK